jgi:DHA1 family multidrug resistance protein-like MFS transporter
VFLAALSWSQIMPFLPLFLKEIGAGGNILAWVGLVYAAQSVPNIISQPFWGKMGDKYGQKPMVVRAGICLAAIYFATSISRRPWELTFYRFLNGVLTGFIPSSFALIAVNSPQALAPRFIASAQMASAAGQILGPTVGGLLAAVVGYRGCFRLSGAAVLLSTILVWSMVKEPNKAIQTEKTSLAQDFAVAIHSPVLTPVMLTIMFHSMFFCAIGAILALHLDTMNGGAPPWVTGLIFALPALAFVLTVRMWTNFGEHHGYERAIYMGFIGGALCGLLLFFARSLYVFAALYFAAGLFMSAVSPSLAAIIVIRVDESFRGRAYGLQFAAGTAGASLAPPAATFIGHLYGIPSVFIFSGIVILVGLVVVRSLISRWEPDSPTTDHNPSTINTS